VPSLVIDGLIVERSAADAIPARIRTRGKRSVRHKRSSPLNVPQETRAVVAMKQRSLIFHSSLFLLNVILLARSLRPQSRALSDKTFGTTNVANPRAADTAVDNAGQSNEAVVVKAGVQDAGAAQLSYFQRMQPQKDVAGSYPYPSDDEMSCSICYLPHICVFERSAYMPEASQAAMIQLARNGLCGLKYESTNDTQVNPVRFVDGLQIRFDKDLNPFAMQPLDLLNIGEGDPFGTHFYHKAWIFHFPHYIDPLFLQVWRLLSAISKLSRSAHAAPEPFPINVALLNPTVIIHDQARSTQKHWYQGFHNFIQLTYPSTIFLDYSNWKESDSACYRSGLVHRCVQDGSGFMNEFRLRTEERLGKDYNAPSDASHIRVGFLTRRDTRKLDGIESITAHLRKFRSRRGVEILTETCAFEDIPFQEQVKFLSRTDVLVAAHGAALSNLFFLPKWSHLIEIYPYGLFPYYKPLASVGNVTYEYEEAFPDPSQTLQCAVLIKDPEFAELFTNSTKLTGSARPSLMTNNARTGCLRWQILRVNEEDMGRRVAEAASRIVRARSSVTR
jgi:Glycosyltransferase 61